MASHRSIGRAFLVYALLGLVIFGCSLVIKIGAAELHHVSRSDRLNGWKTLRDFENLYRPHRDSVVEILEDGDQVSLGTVVSEDGFIVTKASEFGQLLEVQLFDYRKYVPELVSVDEENDFALLKIDAEGLHAVQWADSSICQMGQWVISPHEDESQVRVGVISTHTREVPKQFGALGVVSVNANDYLTKNDLKDLNKLADILNEGNRPIDRWIRNEVSDATGAALEKDMTNPFHRSTLEDALLSDLNFFVFEKTLYSQERFEGIELRAETRTLISEQSPRRMRSVLNRMLLADAYPGLITHGNSGARILEVVSESAAEKADLKSGDVILSIDSSNVNGSIDLTRLVRQHTAGETIFISILRNGEEMKKRVSLGFFDSTFPDQDVNIALSGDISNRRTGFQEIIQHDSPLPPKAMGGPLFNLEGRAIGINIARYDRVATFALPSALVQTLINKLK